MTIARHPGLRCMNAAFIAALLLGAPAVPASPPPLEPLPRLDLTSYLGTWYQVAWFPNRFQRRCVSDTRAIYGLREDGQIEVINRCRREDGRIDSVTGVARPKNATITGSTLAPARLQVSFLPAWLRWVPAWGDYWVIQLADDGRYAVVSEDSRRYLWVLSRTPELSASDESAIRSRLLEQGFALDAWQSHPHAEPAEGAAPVPRDPSPASRPDRQN
jgi:apolipoprotein D and lipocalin family protein